MEKSGSSGSVAAGGPVARWLPRSWLDVDVWLLGRCKGRRRRRSNSRRKRRRKRRRRRRRQWRRRKQRRRRRRSAPLLLLLSSNRSGAVTVLLSPAQVLRPGGEHRSQSSREGRAARTLNAFSETSLISRRCTNNSGFVLDTLLEICLWEACLQAQAVIK